VIPSGRAPQPERKKCADCLHRYAMCAESRQWTLDRLTQSSARIVIALGTVAEHGLLKLLDSYKDYKVWDIIHRVPVWRPQKHREPSAWTQTHAQNRKGIKSRLSSPTPSCWCVGTASGGIRWYVVPVFHPQAAAKSDPSYRRTLSYLEAVMRRISTP
jgi:hypothetical protein